ncbi:uncharacterized protein DUF4397 [Albibacterium bauzanense]|uniref:Uncharacterized protein DUF4397 n=2 Tax=Albibacterium bauzanense TaxID=653929 RepID=A0A4R1LQ65_9SPHI|nr:uncharacterized protein DUF4397 [Albibacterium bauzanense]
MNFYQNLKNVSLLKTMKLPILCLALAVTYSSCSDDDNPMPNPDTAIVSVYHASPSTDSLDFYLDAKKVNSKLVGLGDSINYVEAFIGDRVAEIKGKDGASIFKESIKLEKDKAYSLFITNEKDKDDAEYVQITDDLTNPAEGKAKIRFVHVSPDAGKLNLAVTGGEDLFTDKEFKSATEFKEITAEKQSFEVVDQESNAVLFTLEDVDIKAGKIYTIWVKGLKDTEDDALKIEAMVYNNK